MPITPIPKALYPLVPQLPGVPPVLRAGAQIFDALTLGFLGAGDIVDSIVGSEPVLWGVFDVDGAPIAEYDSVVSVNVQEDARISDYPVEQGSFASYNKVDLPRRVTVVLACGGSVERRSKFQSRMQAERRSLNLWTVITDDNTFFNCNLVALDWGRSQERGATRIEAFCEFQEVRERSTAAFSDPADPSGADAVDLGQVQPVDDPTIDVSGLA